MSALPGRPVGGIGMPFRGFSRLRVLDFSKLLPGPYATQVLADMGCRVTRVELPHAADLMRQVDPLLYRMVNDGKAVLRLDYRKPAGMARLRRLIARADVMVETFRPGRMQRMGLGYEDCRRLNPRLVYCSLSGYAEGGPSARKAGHDLNFLAASGYLDAAGGASASLPPAPLADLAGSMAAVSGILAALLERGVTGRGRLVRLAMAQAIRSWLVLPLAQAFGKRKGMSWWLGRFPFYRLYRTKDGGAVAVAAMERTYALALLEALELRALADVDPWREPERLARALEAKFRQRTTAAWARMLSELDVCVTPVLSLRDAARPSRSRSAGRT